MIKLDPVHLQAAVDLVDEFTFGDVISMTWLREHFEIEIPETGSARTYEDISFKLLSCMDGLKEELLISHKMVLQNVRGEGYRIVPTKEQTGFALTQFAKRISKTCRKAEKHMSNIHAHLLSASELTENVDARSRVTCLRQLNDRRRVSIEFPKQKVIEGKE